MTITDSERERVRRMSAAGYSLREIGSALGCSHERVRQILASSEALPHPPIAINARADGTVVLSSDADPAVLGAAIRRALREMNWPVAGDTPA